MLSFLYVIIIQYIHDIGVSITTKLVTLTPTSTSSCVVFQNTNVSRQRRVHFPMPYRINKMRMSAITFTGRVIKKAFESRH